MIHERKHKVKLIYLYRNNNKVYYNYSCVFLSFNITLNHLCYCQLIDDRHMQYFNVIHLVSNQ